jgi:hypothetical protein
MSTVQDRERLLQIADKLKDKFKFLSKMAESSERDPVSVSEHIQIDSDSEREAVDLFDNLAPVEDKKELQKKANKKEQKAKPAREKPKETKETKEVEPAPKELQNSIRSILRQRVDMDEEKPTAPKPS